ncbi:MAG: hypothetical protein EPN70_20400 [Paraburkholderia sp.]|uniref:hypothetical protein n=1 Tax=Paraburkholderia sp. TaxID=1926495 RepID=UPI00121B5E5F|nr:hypothetical protein [Paraburkholderia sp.]TAM01108.1 MAG: hypothetical protein EPN70_20400 [Paraburkholderia sp.]TAM30382.1 MAG: hypothetical protein EPN59_09490 [Paraburkholderia sp.]
MSSIHPAAPEMALTNRLRRPLRDMLALLPQLPTTETGVPDYAEADADLLVSLAESAELVLQIIHDGVSSIGLLNALTAQRIADGELRAEHIVAVGRLQVELGEALAYAYALAVACRRHTADYIARGTGSTGQRQPGGRCT